MEHIPSASGRHSVAANPPTREPSEGLCSKICSFVKSFFTYLLLFVSLGCCDLREKEITTRDDRSPSPNPVPSALPRAIPSPLPLALGHAHVVAHVLPPVLPTPDSPPPVVAHVSPTPPSPIPVVVHPHVGHGPRPDRLPTGEENLQVFDYLKQEHPYVEGKFEFEIDGVAFCAWKSMRNEAINIQETTACANTLLDYSRQKRGISIEIRRDQQLGISFDARSGEITSVFVDGESKGTDFPQDRIRWMKVLKDHILSPEGTDSAEKNMLEQMHKFHKGYAHRVSFELSNGTGLIAWFNTQYSIILIQEKTSFYARQQTNKIGLQLDGEGEIIKVHFENVDKGNEVPAAQKEWVKALKKWCVCEKRAQLARESKPAQKFDKHDLIMLKTYLARFPNIRNPLSFIHNGTEYAAWTFSGDCYIQEKDKISTSNRETQLSLRIGADGQLKGFRFQGQNFRNIPSQLFVLLHTCMDTFVVSETIYTSQPQASDFLDYTPIISADVLKYAIPRGVEIHLNAYATHLDSVMTISAAQADTMNPSHPDEGVFPTLSINFLNEHLVGTGGIDAGGLSRSYFPDVVAAICDRHHPNMHVIKRAGASRPMTKMETSEDDPTLKMTLTAEEESSWNKLGKMMMHCFHSKNTGHYTAIYVTGAYFDDTLFKVIRSLNPWDLKDGIETMSANRLINLMRALIDGDPDGEQFVTTIELLDNPLESLGDKLIAESFYNSGGDCEDWGSECFSTDSTAVLGVDISKVKENWVNVQQGLKNGLLSSSYAREIAPAIAIARGMMSLVNRFVTVGREPEGPTWYAMLSSMSEKEFIEKIQGTIDRQKVADQIVLEDPHSFSPDKQSNLQQKILWLKEWLVDDITGAKEEDVKLFLRFVTGGMSLPDREIKVNESYSDSPLPGSHTCSIVIDIKATPTVIDGFDDTTKEGFIACLQSSMSTDGIIG